MHFVVIIIDTKLIVHNMAKKLLDQMSDKIRIMHYSSKTEDSYISWAKRFILFNNKKHPSDMGKVEIEAFLLF